MTRFADKFLRGQRASDTEWKEHLLAAHRDAPGMSPDAFAAHTTRDGLNSYEGLAGAVALPAEGDAVVLDLGCGDGHLARHVLPKLGPNGRYIGVDMSEAELAAAVKSCRDPRARFQQACADALPLGDASVDLALSHMVLMLVLPVEPAIRELARVLKPGAPFVAVVNHPTGSSGPFAALQSLIAEVTGKRFPEARRASWGDPRVRTAEGLRELFNPGTGFEADLTVSEFALLVDLSPDGVWEFFKNMYFVAMLPAEAKAAAKDEILSFAKGRADEDGRIRFELPMRRLSARRRSGQAEMRA